MPEYWKVRNETYAFGRATVYQTSDKTARDILSGVVSDVDLWLEKSKDDDVKSGRIYKDDLTHTLLEGVAFVHLKQGAMELRIGLGSGALMGGLDKELIYTRIVKDQYDHLEIHIAEFKKYDELLDDISYDKNVEKDLARSLLDKSQQKEYDTYMNNLETEIRLLSIIRPYCKSSARKSMNEPGTLALLKKKSNLPKKAINEFPLTSTSLDDVSTPTLNHNILKGQLGLKQLGYSTRNIASIHYSTLSVPHLLVMKDGRQIMAAPYIPNNIQPSFLGDLLDKARQTKKDKEQELKIAFMDAV